MNKAQLKRKVKSMFREMVKDDFVGKRVDKILLSGAIDIKKYEDNFRLPKIFLSAILREAAFQYEPVNTEDKKQALKLFTVT